MLSKTYFQILCVICVTGIICAVTTDSSATVTSSSPDVTSDAPAVATSDSSATVSTSPSDVPAVTTSDVTSDAPIVTTSDSSTTKSSSPPDVTSDSTAVTTSDVTTDAPAATTSDVTTDAPAVTTSESTTAHQHPGTKKPELDTEGIILTCTDTEMIVEIPKNLLTGEMSGEDVRFENEEDLNNTYCWGEDNANGTIITVTTNLTACGTDRTEKEKEEVYTNRVISRYQAGDVISRQYAIDIPLSCTYNRSKLIGGEVRYKLTDYTIDKVLDEEGAYSFSFDIYTDGNYREAVEIYPKDIGLNEELYFAASVLSLDGTLDLSIRSCRATPNSNHDSDVKVDFIVNACSLDDDTKITYLTNYSIGVEMNTFRFIDGGDLVYIHCDLLVCDAENAESLCKERCANSTSMITQRRRRDVSSGLKTKRFTRGPLRVRRAAQSQESISRMDISQSGVSTQQEFTTAFNPWMVAIAAMATVVMAMAAMMVVVLRKVSTISAAPKRGQYKEESARFLEESEEI